MQLTTAVLSSRREDSTDAVFREVEMAKLLRLVINAVLFLYTTSALGA